MEEHDFSYVPRAWHGVDGSTTVLVLTPAGELRLWTNLCTWITLEHELEAVSAAEGIAQNYGLEEWPRWRVLEMLGLSVMTDEEYAGYGDSQER